MGDTKIDWATKTWSPLVGCTKVSPGCQNCFAIRDAWRMMHSPNPATSKAYDGLIKYIPPTRDTYSNIISDHHYEWTGIVRLLTEKLDEPTHWRSPQRVFVVPRGDLFHEAVPFSYIDKVVSTMIYEGGGHHQYLVLTKRPERMAEYTKTRIRKTLLGPLSPWAPNIWIGVTAENQEMARKRIPILLDIPAAHRWVSVEPMLGEVELPLWLHPGGIEWVVAGSESGPNARADQERWYRDLILQCRDRAPLFIKQVHEPYIGTDGRVHLELVKMPEFDGKVRDEYPLGLILPWQKESANA